MKTIAKLEQEANKRRSSFKGQVVATADKLRLGYLVEKAMGYIDPDFSKLKRMQKRTEENPFALFAAVAGLFLLVRQISTPSNLPETAKPARRSRLTGTTLKGDNHGQHINAE